MHDSVQESARPPLRPFGPFAVILAALGLLLAVAYFSSARHSRNVAAAAQELPASARQLIALGRFSTEDVTPDQAEFARRWRQEITQRFGDLLPSAQIPQNATRFHSALPDPLPLARQLGANSLLEGEIRFGTNEILLSAHLRDVKTGQPLWHGTNRTPLLSPDLLWTNLVRETIPPATRTLRAKDQARAARVLQARAEALAHHALGLGLLEQSTSFTTPAPLTREASARATAQFEQALALYPSFTQPHLSLASLHRATADRCTLPREAMPQALHALDSLLALDPHSNGAAAHMALLKMLYDWDWPGAEGAFQKVLLREPGNSQFQAWYARLLQCQNRLAEARAPAARAYTLSPGDFLAVITLTEQLALEGRLDEALSPLDTWLAQHPASVAAACARASILARQGKPEAALDALSRLPAGDPSPEVLGWSGHYLARLGRTAEAEQNLRDIKELGRRTYVSPLYPAVICVALGRKRETLMHLGNAYTYRSPFLVGLKVDFPWADLQSEPRFQDLVHRVGL